MEHLTRLEGKNKQGTLPAAVQRACGMAGISWQCGWTGGLAWPPDAFIFQWVLAVVQVSNWFPSESLRAAKVLEESQQVIGPAPLLSVHCKNML